MIAGYDYDRIRSVGEYLCAPSKQLQLDLRSLKQGSFPNNYRLVFSCFEDISDSVANDFVTSLQKSLTFLDIPNFFVVLLSNNPNIEHMVLDAKNKYSYEEVPVQFVYVDTPKVAVTGVATALLNPPDTICAQPWISLDITAQGEYRPCCFFKEPLKDNNGIPFHASKDSFETVYNSDSMKQLREDFRQGLKPKPCLRCWKEEADNTESKRQLLKHRFFPDSYNANWEQDDVANLLFVSIAFGNICNLKCRICSPYCSSQIATEAVEHSNLPNKKEHFAYQALTNGMWIKNNDAELWKQLCDPTLNFTHLDISGGEPMLSDKHFKVLQELVNIGKSKDITIHYNSNGTIFPKEHIELFKQFKEVDIALSIDNLGARFEYERPGVSWDIVSDNIDSYLALQIPNIKISLHLAVNIQNVYYLPEICQWIDSKAFDSYHFSVLYDPTHLCISNVTAEARSLILEKLKNYKSFEQLNNIIAILETAKLSDGSVFLKYMHNLDEIRRQNFATAHPEIAYAMGYQRASNL